MSSFGLEKGVNILLLRLLGDIEIGHTPKSIIVKVISVVHSHSIQTYI